MRGDDGLILSGVGVEKDGRTLLAGIDLSIPDQAFCALIGPSGAGKSSLLRLLNRLDDPSRGSITWRGQPLDSIPVKELRRRIGFVFQKSAMFPGSVADNLLAPLRIAGSLPTDADTRARTALDRAGLPASLLTRTAGELSGGEQQRLAVARALMTRPEVLLLDEPTASLDVESAEHLIALFIRLREQDQLTLVMVSHRLEEARACASQVVMLEAGRIVESGAAPAFFETPTQVRTREFLAAATLFNGAK